MSDIDAISALALVLDLEDVTTRDLDQLQEVQDQLPEAFAETPEISGFAVPERGATNGDLARAALIYLAEQGPADAPVAEAVARPRREGQRDPLSLAIGGLILLALKSDIQLKRSSAGKWTFSYHLQPVKDSALLSVFSKLWGIYGGR